MPLPASLLHHLQRVVPGFVDEEPTDQLSLARMLWTCAEGGREHKLWPDMLSLSRDEIRELWVGGDRRMRAVVGHRYFTVHQGNNLTETTSAYAPSRYMAQALVQTISDRKTADWIDEAGGAWVPPRKAIASMAAGGTRQTAWKGAQPRRLVPINIDALQDYRCRLVEAWNSRPLVRKGADWALRQLRSVDVAMMLSRSPRWPGAVPIRYVEGSTGRITAQGHSLQSMPGLVRSAALAGAYDYDISTCQWTILAQLADKFGVPCPLMRAYIADKRALRQRVAAGANISEEDAKKCLTALLFGAKVQRSERAMRFHPGELVDEIGRPAALRLARQPDFMALYEEVGKVGRSIVQRWRRKQGQLVNDLGVRFRNGSELAHLLQGAEAAALRAVVMQQQDNILLCLHDGWVTENPVEVDDLADHILKETGYRFSIEHSQLEAPGSDRIKSKLDEFEAVSEGELAYRCPFAVTQGEGMGEGRSGGLRAVLDRDDGRHTSVDDAVSLWTSYPYPERPVPGRLAFVSPRPKWNLPPGSTAETVDRRQPQQSNMAGS